MNKIILILFVSILTSCFYREDFHKPKHKKGLNESRKEGRKYKSKNPYKEVNF
jgi:hypothetical protein